MADSSSIEIRLVRRCVFAFALVTAASAASACGRSPCEEAAEKACARACACGRCGIAIPTNSEVATGSLKLYFDDEADCEAATSCDDTEASDEQFATCSADLDDAVCEEGAVLMPESCNET